MGQPLTTEEFITRHSAGLQSLGFDIQFAAFIFYLLKIQCGDEIVYENEDDLVVFRHDGTRWLIQVKNSVEDNAKLTDADNDFWKTLDNWIQLYHLADDKDEFLKDDNRFILFTNKKFENKFCDKIRGLQNGNEGIDEVFASLKAVKSTVSYYTIVQELLKLDRITLRRFLVKIYFVRVKDVFGDIYEQFLNFYFKPTKADEVFSKLLGRMLREKAKILEGKGVYRYEKGFFLQKHKDLLQQLFSEDLTPLISDTTNCPENVMEYPFMKRLDKINVVDDECDQKIYYGYWLCYFNSYQQYCSVQLMTPELEKQITQKAFPLWYNTFQESHVEIFKTSPHERKNIAARRCFYNVMKMNIPYSDSHFITIPFSSGWFLNMTNDDDNPQICWHYDEKSEVLKS